MIDDYRATRLRERGARKGSTVSVATVNGELRTLRAVLQKAEEWHYIASVPKFNKLREDLKIKHVTEDHFGKIYEQCDAATVPEDLPYPAGDWWRAFIVFSFMTGWRMSEVLRLTWDTLDLENAKALTLAADNKGHRDEWCPLHPIVVDHLAGLRSFRAEVFPWDRSERRLYAPFHAIQKAAGIHLPCHEKHVHSDSCHLYGFHDLRRGFATVIAKEIGPKLLQKLMRHKSYQTTQRYVDLRDSLQGITESYNVSDPRKKMEAVHSATRSAPEGVKKEIRKPG